MLTVAQLVIKKGDVHCKENLDIIKFDILVRSGTACLFS